MLKIFKVLKFTAIVLIACLISACSSLSKQSAIANQQDDLNTPVLDNWYRLKSDNTIGFAHYYIFENDSNYTLNFEFKYKANADTTVYYTKGELVFYKDAFLTTKSFECWFNSGRRKLKNYYIKGYVSSTQEEQSWLIQSAYQLIKSSEGDKMYDLPNVKRSFKTNYPVLADILLPFYISQQKWHEIGQKISFNTMELTKGPKYKANTFIEYAANDTTQEKGATLKTLQYGINKQNAATFTLDSANNVIQYSYTKGSLFSLCTKEDIDPSLF